jgi:hypothetical protein
MPNAQQMEAELTVAFLAFTERYTSRVTCVPCESVKVCLNFFFLFLFLFCLVCIGKREGRFLLFSNFSLTSVEL